MMPDAAPQPEPWDRNPGEPNRWFARFERYRLAGLTRSVVGTWTAEQAEKGRERRTKVPGSWNHAVIRWRWRQRAEAWDEFERQQAREAHAKAIEEMNARHIEEARAMQTKAIQRLKSLELRELSSADVARFFVEATKLERTARGEPEAIEERRLTGRGGGPIGFSLEDAVNADQELENWEHDQVQPPGGESLPEGNQEVP
jgi:hypothetical protein